MSPVEFSAIFGLGVVSSIHCVQMCGPIVLAYSLGTKRRLASHLMYNAGRIFTYAALGALAGATSGLAARLAGMAHSLQVLAGVAMLVAAAAIAGLLPSTSLITIERPGVMTKFRRAAGRLILSPNKLKLGLLLGFMPCGLVYAALLKAAESGTAAGGALTMLAFGLGTAGTLATIGVVSCTIAGKFGRWSNVLAAASIAGMGVILLWRGIAGAPMGHHHG
jgi:sulfite exporter TauE/SafE